MKNNDVDNKSWIASLVQSVQDILQVWNWSKRANHHSEFITGGEPKDSAFWRYIYGAGEVDTSTPQFFTWTSACLPYH